jgi:hypothetical protein
LEQNQDTKEEDIKKSGTASVCQSVRSKFQEEEASQWF